MLGRDTMQNDEKRICFQMQSAKNEEASLLCSGAFAHPTQS